MGTLGRLFVLVAFCLLPRVVVGAEIIVRSADSIQYPNYASPNRLMVIDLVGPIEDGDADRLSGILANAAYQPHFEFDRIVLVLSSPGGSFAEALRIGDVVKEQIVETYVEAGRSCLSACAIVFMAGTGASPDSTFPKRRLHPQAKLGFHAPSLLVDRNASVRGSQVVRAYALAIKTMSELVDRAELYDLKDSLLVEMLTTSPNDMSVVQTVGDANRWNIALDIPARVRPFTDEEIILICLATKDYRQGQTPNIPSVSGGLPSQYPVDRRVVTKWGQEHRLAMIMSSPFAEEICGILDYDKPSMEVEYTFGDHDAMASIYRTSNWVGSLVNHQYAFNPSTPLSQLAAARDSSATRIGCPSAYAYIDQAGEARCRPPD